MVQNIRIRVNKLLKYIQTRNTHLQFRLIISYLVVIILPLSLVGFYSYLTLGNTVMDEISSSINQTISQTSLMISTDMSGAREISDLIYINPKVQNMLLPRAKMEFSEYQSFILELRDQLKYLTSYNNAYDVVLYYMDKGQFPASYSAPELKSEANIKDSSAYKKMMENKATYYWGVTKLKRFGNDNSESVYMMLLREVKNLETGDHIGFMSVSYREQYVADILQKVKLGDSGFLFILDEAGQIVSHHNKELLMTDISDRTYAEKIKNSASGNFIEKIANEEYLFNYTKIEGTGWKVVGVVRVQELTGKLNYIKMAIVIIGAFCIIIAILFSLRISNDISRRIKKLAKAMKRIEEGNLDVSIKSEKAADEISLLYAGFNSMQEEIRNLIAKNKVTDQRKRLAELKALQHQINPHFLYNTLDSINWLAASRYKAKDISMMVTSLASLFRLSLNKSNDITTVQNEIEHVKSYVNIQKIRFDSTFDVRYEVDPSLYDIKITKLILQPLVENAIIHGFKDIDYMGEIVIRIFKRDETLYFEVSDNGVGCDVDKMNGKLSGYSAAETNLDGYGIINVDEKIKLCYGNKYGVVFCNNEAEGTTVRITLPANSNEGGLSNAKDADS